MGEVNGIPQSLRARHRSDLWHLHQRTEACPTTSRITRATQAEDGILHAIARPLREVVLTPEGKRIVLVDRLMPGLADRVAARAVT